MAKKKKEESKNDDFLAKEAAESQATATAYTLDIPEDEIWTYQIEGLQAPHIAKPFKNAGKKKVVVVIALLVAIGLSIFMSVRAVHSNLYKYKELDDGTYELVKFSNDGSVTDITIDYVVDIKTGEKDINKPISTIHEYAFNCDETLHSITFGKDVKSIDQKSIYSCWYVRNVWIDDENPYYCDLDGVVYNKDVTEAVFYPNYHDLQLMVENGYATEDENKVFASEILDDENNPMERLWGTTKKYDEQYYQTYNKTCRTYVIPSTVTKINELAFAYSNIVDLYIPEGVTVMDNMAIFKNTVLTNIFSYTCDRPIIDTTFNSIDDMKTIYSSLPEGLESIGSDCMYYTRALNYMYLPSSVKTIGHHAFWDAVYKEDKQLRGVTAIDTSFKDEQTFKSQVKTGDQWRPQYDYMAFKKSIDVNYDTERTSQYAWNVNRQYYWAVQWVINNTSAEVKEKSRYLVKDFDADGTPELVLRTFDESKNKTVDHILTFKYNYLADYEGDAEYDPSDTFLALTDNAQLDMVLNTASSESTNYQ